MSYLCNLYQSGFVVGFFGILAYFFEGYKKRMNCISVHPFLYVVCSARALSNGCKSRVSPNSGNYIAKGKGVHREVKSERSRRQTFDLTDRNFIQGI